MDDASCMHVSYCREELAHEHARQLRLRAAKIACEKRQIVDVSFVGALGPPGGGRQIVTNRFLRYFNFVSFPELDDGAMKQIFNVVLQTFVKAYLPPDLLEVVHPMVDATIELYNVIGKELLPTPSKPHYTFNLRDVASVIQVS